MLLYSTAAVMAWVRTWPQTILLVAVVVAEVHDYSWGLRQVVCFCGASAASVIARFVPHRIAGAMSQHAGFHSWAVAGGSTESQDLSNNDGTSA